MKRKSAFHLPIKRITLFGNIYPVLSSSARERTSRHS